jgi:hypothetical protein
VTTWTADLQASRSAGVIGGEGAFWKGTISKRPSLSRARTHSEERRQIEQSPSQMTQ